MKRVFTQLIIILCVLIINISIILFVGYLLYDKDNKWVSVLFILVTSLLTISSSGTLATCFFMKKKKKEGENT